jgi:hypothetical protein
MGCRIESSVTVGCLLCSGCGRLHLGSERVLNAM